MRFSDPFFLLLLWGAAFLAGVAVYGIRKRRRILERFVHSALWTDMVPDLRQGRRKFKAALLTAVLVPAVIALAGPQAGFRWKKIEQKGVDIMIALDCSRSMLAADIPPTRLERAKREILDLLAMMRSDRAGLVAFSGSALLQCPLTLDHSAFSLFLDVLNPEYLPRGGTDISGALRTALDGFEWETASEKAVILITDGENTVGDPLAPARDAAEKGVRIFCIGVGKADGAPVPDAAGGFKKDRQGRIIMSRVDDALLTQIADLADGVYVKSVAGDMDLDRIYTGEILGNMERTVLDGGRKKVWENRFQWFLLPCLLLLAAEMMIGEGKKDPVTAATGRFSRWLPFLLPVLLAGMGMVPHDAIAGASARVKEGVAAYEKGDWEAAQQAFIDAQLQRPELPELYYNIGSAAYQKGEYETAFSHFSKAAEAKGDPALQQKALYNLGNTRYRMNDLEGAIKTYEQIPEDSPLFEKARENLTFVQQKLEEQKKAQQPSSGDGDSQNEGGEDNQKGARDSGSGNSSDSKQPDASDDGHQKPDKEEDADSGSGGDQGQLQQDQQKSRLSPDQDPETAGPQASKDGSPAPDQDASGDDENQDRSSGTLPDKEKDQRAESGTQPAGHPDPHRQDEQNKAYGAGKADTERQGAQETNTSPGAGGIQALSPVQQQMLDRLKDAPGRALMPASGGKTVEKDW